MEAKQAKEILERYNNYKKIFEPNEVTEALEIAIQCLEDSIEGEPTNKGIFNSLPKCDDNIGNFEKSVLGQAAQQINDANEKLKAKEVKDKGCACYGNNKIHPCFCNPYKQKSKIKE